VSKEKRKINQISNYSYQKSACTLCFEVTLSAKFLMLSAT